MIRAGWPRAGLAAVLLLGGVLAARAAAPASADPSLVADRQAWLASVAGEADAALAALEAELVAALDEARTGAARIVEGAASPDEPLAAAADVLRGAGGAARAAGEAVSELDGVLRAAQPAAAPLPEPASPGELQGIAAQLLEGAAAADPFVERRRASEEVLEHLDDALAALDRGEPATAIAALDAAAAAQSVVADWDDPPATLPFWLRTTEDLIAAARGIAEAVLAGDQAAAAAAARAYAALAGDAHRADVALAVSMSEAGGALVATPLRRLADALAAVADARAVASALQSTD